MRFEGVAFGVEKKHIRVEAKQLCIESWVHPHLKEAPVIPVQGSGLDMLMQSATHKLGSLSICFSL